MNLSPAIVHIHKLKTSQATEQPSWKQKHELLLRRWLAVCGKGGGTCTIFSGNKFPNQNDPSGPPLQYRMCLISSRYIFTCKFHKKHCCLHNDVKIIKRRSRLDILMLVIAEAHFWLATIHSLNYWPNRNPKGLQYVVQLYASIRNVFFPKVTCLTIKIVWSG